MVYANLSAGIIKSVRRVHAAHASGLFVASLYIPAAFAGYLLDTLKEHLGWSTAGMVQVARCAIVATGFTLLAAAGRQRPAHIGARGTA